MFLDEFESEIKRILLDIDCVRRSEDQALESINHLIDAFAVRFSCREHIVRYVVRYARQYCLCSDSFADRIAGKVEAAHA
jgi:hypothetical protein